MTTTEPVTDGMIGYQPGEHALNNVISFLEAHCRNFPERPALRWVDAAGLAQWDGNHATPFQHQQISYGDFTNGITSLSAGLAGLGIHKGDRVVIFLPMGVLMYQAMFAVQRLGAIAVFLDSWARRAQLGASAAGVDPTAMISHQAAFDLIEAVPEFARMAMCIIAGPGDDARYTARLEQLLQSTAYCPLAPVAGNDTALITFTTGSSGTPKGANRTHRFLAAQHRALAQTLDYSVSDQDMPAFPIFSLNNLASGVTTVIPALNLAAPSARDNAALTAQMLHEPISCATLSPSMLNSVSQYCREQAITLNLLRRVVTGGAPISRDNVRDFMAIAPGAEVLVFYGSTEVEPMAHIAGSEMLAQPVAEDPDIIETGVNVGHIEANLRYIFIRIITGPISLRETPWSALEVHPGAVGEFVVSGEHVCRDYYNNPAAFQQTKIVDEDGTVWHRTGDLARLDQAGYLWIVGRSSNVIRRGDSYLFPVQAEVLLKRVAGVRQAAFLGLPDPELGERAVAALELLPGGHDLPALRREVQRVLEKNNIPLDALYVVESIPLDPRHFSKVEYGTLCAAILNTQLKDLLANG